MSHEKYQRLLELAKTLQPIVTAVAHPCDESSLSGAVDAAKLGLIKPILVGPQARRSKPSPKQFKLDISGYELVDAPHSHAAAAAAVELVAGRQGRGADEGQPPHRRADGRGGEDATRAAHRAPHQPLLRDGRADAIPDALIISDAAVNIAPTLEDKVDIVQNAIDLAHALRAPRCGSRSCRRWRR